MTSTWVPVVIILVVSVRQAKSGNDSQPCAQIHTSSPAVPLGAPVSATCVISEDCSLAIGQAVQIKWRLGDRFVPAANASGRVSEVFIASFNRTRATLSCWIQASPPQEVAGVFIRAGYPPEAPQNLSCQTNLTSPVTLTCSWSAGQRDPHLPTQYTLHTNIWSINKNYTYDLPPGVHSFIIHRSDFVLFSEMDIYVKAVNHIGEAHSSAITLDPVSATKFDPPEIRSIQVVPKKYSCLSVRWSMSKDQSWMNINRMNLQVRHKSACSRKWNETILMKHVKASKPTDVCQLLHGTQYSVQIRVSYQQSPWSEWSSSQSGVTLERAPAGRLDSWMKVSRDNMPKQLNIHLFWKPSKLFRANGQNVSYMVSVQKQPGERGKVCSTTGTHCTFQLPARAKKVYLRAANAAGKSSPTEVRVLQNKNRTAILRTTAIPQDDSTLLVRWKSAVTPDLTGCVVEWRPLLQKGLAHIQFEIVDKNQSSLVLPGSFEPYKPYGIWVYPRFKDGVGLPQTVNAYLRQKAPSMVPKIQIRNTWRSHVELTWDEIPLSQRNGIIHSYKIFYWSEKGPIKIVDADPNERKVFLKDLNSVSLYGAFMMASTFGGSLNGSTIHFEVESIDVVSIVIIVTAVGVGLSLLLIFFVLTCFSKHKRLKKHFWPNVPDPANSSIKRWTSDSTQDTHLCGGIEEPDFMYLSHLSFLDLAMKLNKEEDLWSNSAGDTSDLGESICGSPFIPGYSGSNSDSVPYATVIFPGPSNSTSPKLPHVYLRSESTQPLLESEESFSPKCYQNMVIAAGENCFFGPNHDYQPEKEEEPWEEFPFLRALAMNVTQDD